MADRTLVVLGTAGQSPTVDRNQSSYALRWNDELFVFDPGENTQRQMMVAGLHISRINRIFITHFHGDHCLGLPGLLQRWQLAGGRETVDLYYGSFGRAHVDSLLAGSEIDFDIGVHHQPFEAGETRHVDGLDITALALDHTVPAVGWRLVEPPRRHLLPDLLAEAGLEGRAIGELTERGTVTVDGRRIEIEDVSEIRPGASMAFVMDTRWCENAVKLATDVDLLVTEATYTSEHEDLAERNGHLTGAQAAAVAREAGARRLVLSHYSQRYEDLGALRAEAELGFPGVIVASDLDVIHI